MDDAVEFVLLSDGQATSCSLVSQGFQGGELEEALDLVDWVAL